MTALLLDRSQTRAALEPAALPPLLRRALIAVRDRAVELGIGTQVDI
jgi:hypothetical protein